jgi:hypothetical protein
MSDVCKNCGESIELVHYSPPEWMHNPPGYTSHKMAGGAFNVFRHCRKSVAEPAKRGERLQAQPGCCCGGCVL